MGYFFELISVTISRLVTYEVINYFANLSRARARCPADFDYSTNGILCACTQRTFTSGACGGNGVNRIYSCLTNSFQLSRVTTIKFPKTERPAYVQLSAKLCTASMQIRHDKIVFIDCRGISVTRRAQLHNRPISPK